MSGNGADGPLRVAVVQCLPEQEARAAREPWEEELVKAPELIPLAFGHVLSLDPRSEERRAAIALTLISGWDAATRRDWELVGSRYHEDCVTQWPAEFATLGMDVRQETFADYTETWEDFRGTWDHFDQRVTHVIDLGDAFAPAVVVLAEARLSGSFSGATAERSVCQICRIRDGLCEQQSLFSDVRTTLEAAGLSGPSWRTSRRSRPANGWRSRCPRQRMQVKRPS